MAQGEHPMDGLGCAFPLWTPHTGLFPTPGMPEGDEEGKKLLGKPNLSFFFLCVLI